MLADLIAKRDAGHVRVSFTTYYGQPLPEVMERFGLGCEEFPDSRLREVERSEARIILISLLRQDMAYHADLMPQQEAETLAEHFLQNFTSNETRFITNLERSDDPRRPFDVASSPMTQSTFDAGIIFLARPIAGCIWIEDED